MHHLKEGVKICGLGIARSFQRTNIFAKLTVYENIQAAFIAHGGRGYDMWGVSERLFRDAVERVERQLGPTHPYTEPVLLEFGRHLTREGRAAEAEPLLRRVLESRTARLGPQDPRTSQAQVRLGACLAALGRAAEAGPLLEAGYARLRGEAGFGVEADDARTLIARPEHARR